MARWLIVLVLAACVEEDVYVFEPGELLFQGRELEIDIVPMPARVGESVFVTVVTMSGSCKEPWDTVVDATEQVVDITPLHRRYIGERDCTHILNLTPHSAELVFDTRGTKTLRIHGTRLVGLDRVRESVTIPITIVVD